VSVVATISAPTSAWEVRQVIRARRNRDRYFPGVLFEDPAWDMLLDLYAAGLERRQISASSLAIAAAVPKTTAYRLMNRLTIDGLFVREQDPFDERRRFISLSESATENMRRYFASQPPVAA
jgi:DNA-binding MarR family transcriptional regulator